MGYGYGGWAPYVSVAERRRKAEKAAAKAKKAGAELSPVEPGRGAIAKTFWGKAWCNNLEQYSDYSNRLPRGRTYVRNGSVIDLKITAGEVRGAGDGVESLYGRCERDSCSRQTMANYRCRLRGVNRLAAGAPAREALQGCHGANLQAGHRPFSGTQRNQIQMQLPGLGLDVQARRRRALWHRRKARSTARAALQFAPGRCQRPCRPSWRRTAESEERAGIRQSAR